MPVNESDNPRGLSTRVLGAAVLLCTGVWLGLEVFTRTSGAGMGGICEARPGACNCLPTPQMPFITEQNTGLGHAKLVQQAPAQWWRAAKQP